ncbi:hypothetical protein [Streptomyces sp. NPDC096934]|uniref:hypothetical protein n=1 Tax=Streptomyces sp. NPDC096934 TaxID=3155551 RepID=UPI003316F360
MSIWAYVVISCACVAFILLDIRGIRIYRALRDRGISVKARCVGVHPEEKGRHTIVLGFAVDGESYRFREIGFTTPVRLGEEFDALYDPAGYAPPSITSKVTKRRAFPYFTVVCLPLVVAATTAFVNGF